MTRFHLFLDNIKSVPVYLLKLNGHLEGMRLVHGYKINIVLFLLNKI